MKKRMILILFLVFMIPMVFALKTSVTIKTEPNSNISIYIIDPNKNIELDVLKINSDKNGNAFFDFNSGAGELAFSITVRDEGKIVMNKEYGNYTSGSSLNFDMRLNCEEDWKCSGWEECKEGVRKRVCIDRNDCDEQDDKPNETENCEVEVIENVNESGESITGYSILDEGNSSNSMMISFGIVFAFVMLFLVVQVVRLTRHIKHLKKNSIMIES